MMSTIVRALPVLLLFVPPAHATMQQVVCEHLPTAHGQIAGEAIPHTPMLRSHSGKAMGCPVAADPANDDIDLAAPAAPLADRSAILDCKACTRPVATTAARLYGLAFSRAPPAASLPAALIGLKQHA